MMEPVHRRLLWSLYILSAAVFFAYLLFPSAAVGRYIETRINRLCPEYRAAFSEAKLQFPLSVGFESVRLNHREEIVLDAADVRIGVEVLSAFTGHFPFSVQVFDGLVNGRIGLGKDGPSIEGTLYGLQISRVSAAEKLMTHKLSGQVNGTFSYHGGGPNKGKGKASLKAIDASIALLPPVFDLDLMRFHSFEADLTVSGAQLEIVRCELKGSDLDAGFTGTIFMKNPIETSIIKVSGTIKPNTVFLSNIVQVLPLRHRGNQRPGKNGIPIHVYNTLETPRFSFR